MRLNGSPLVLEKATTNDTVFASLKALLNRSVARGTIDKHGARYVLLDVYGDYQREVKQP
jgi:hypothetical protein